LSSGQIQINTSFSPLGPFGCLVPDVEHGVRVSVLPHQRRRHVRHLPGNEAEEHPGVALQPGLPLHLHLALHLHDPQPLHHNHHRHLLQDKGDVYSLNICNPLLFPEDDLYAGRLEKSNI